jgi:RHS repeat-associated protein
VTAENVVGSPPNGPVAYGYDPVNRLTSANYGAASLAYQHDPADRLTQVTQSSRWGSVVSSLAYDAASELVSLTRTQGSQVVQKLQYSYDGNGNRTQTVDQTGAATSFSYDQANRLVDYAGKAQYTYNGYGLRMSKTVGGVAEPFTWDMSGRLPQLIQDGTTRYVTGLDGLPLEQINSDGTVRYYHQDTLGSTRALTNGQGQIDSVYAYDPYGKVAVFTGSNTANPFQFAGQYTDVESGLQYLRARYYEPATGQFMTRDPLLAATRQAYVYAQHDPVNRVDRNGLYDYQYDQYIGTVSDTGGAANVMSFLQQNLAAMFPFSTGACSQVVLGAQCLLQPVPFDLVPSEVTITSVTATSFTFTSGTGHIAGPGGTITFSTYESGGSVYLRETAHAPNASWWENIVDPPGALANWLVLANNLKAAFPPACPPTIIPILPLPFL